MRHSQTVMQANYVFRKVDNPDGWREPTTRERAQLPDMLVEGPLAERVLMLHGVPYLAVRGLGPADVEPVFADDPARVGLQINQLGVAPGLDPWLVWDGLARIEHLSCNTAFLGARGLEALLNTDRLERVTSLDLGVCDLGTKGLKLLAASNGMPKLRELYLTANPDYDRTKHNERALAALLKPSKKAPIGASLTGLTVLGLMFWELGKAHALLESSEVIAGLDRLWVWRAKDLPASLRTKAVQGWDETPA